MKTRTQFKYDAPLRLNLESRKKLAALFIQRKAPLTHLTEAEIQQAIYCAGRYLECGNSLRRALVTSCGDWILESFCGKDETAASTFFIGNH